MKNDEIKPVNKPRGWHNKKEFIDDSGQIFNKGVYVGIIDNTISDIVNSLPQKSNKVKTVSKNSVIYNQYIIDKIPFVIYLKGTIIFDSKHQPKAKYPCFKDTHFALFNKEYKYNGIRIERGQ